MSRSFSLFLALRYLRPKRTFLSLITVISILGVTIGITVLILVISVMTGFEQELRRKVLGFDAHLVAGGESVLFDWPAQADKIRAVEGVTGVAPMIRAATRPSRSTTIVLGMALGGNSPEKFSRSAPSGSNRFT